MKLNLILHDIYRFSELYEGGEKTNFDNVVNVHQFQNVFLKINILIVIECFIRATEQQRAILHVNFVYCSKHKISWQHILLL